MNSLKTIAFAVILICMSFCSFAQDISGMKIAQEYSKEDVIARLGKPDRFKDYGDGMYFYYGKNMFQFSEWAGEKGYGFSDFDVFDSKYVAFTSWIEGGLKVGDDISRVKLMLKLNPILYITKILSDTYCINDGDAGSIVIVFNSQNKITNISYCMYL